MIIVIYNVIVCYYTSQRHMHGVTVRKEKREIRVTEATEVSIQV